MQAYNFTQRVRKVFELARDEALRLHHEYVGTEHLLLGLIREGEGVASAVLQNLNVDSDEIRETIEGVVKKGRAAVTTGPDLPYTSRAKTVLEQAMAEARDLGHNYVGTEHILLGLLREERGVAAQVLAQLGLRLESVRAEALRLLGTPAPGRRDPTDPADASALRRPTGIKIQFDYGDNSWSEATFERVEDAIAFLRRFRK